MGILCRKLTVCLPLAYPATSIYVFLNFRHSLVIDRWLQTTNKPQHWSRKRSRCRGMSPGWPVPRFHPCGRREWHPCIGRRTDPSDRASRTLLPLPPGRGQCSSSGYRIGPIQLRETWTTEAFMNVQKKHEPLQTAQDFESGKKQSSLEHASWLSTDQKCDTLWNDKKKETRMTTNTSQRPAARFEFFAVDVSRPL